MQATADAIAVSSAFDRYDADASGCLSIEELAALVHELAPEAFTDAELVDAFAALDSDASGKIEKAEFITWWDMKGGGSDPIRETLAAVAQQMRVAHFVDLHTAAWAGNLDVVLQFLDLDPDCANEWDETEFGAGNSALHYAAYNGHLDVCEALVDAGVDVDAPNDAGCTPLFFAAQQGHVDVAKFLLARAANPAATDNTVGLSVMDVAEPEVAALMAGSVRQLPPAAVEDLRVRQRRGCLLATWATPCDRPAPGVKAVCPPVTGYTVQVFTVKPQAGAAAAAGAGASDAGSHHDGDHNGDGTLVKLGEMTAPPDVLEAVVKGLDRGVGAVVKVSAVNSCGSGPATASPPVVVARVPSPPRAPTASVVDTTVALTWEAAGGHGVAVTRYKLAMADCTREGTGALQYMAAGTFPGHERQAKVTGLRRGRRYRFKLVAVSSGGTSDGSAAVDVDIPRSVLPPSRPRRSGQPPAPQ